MPSILRTFFPVAALLGAFAITGCGNDQSTAPDAASALSVSEPRLVLPPPGRNMAAGYLSFVNQGNAPLVIQGLSTAAYERVEMHTMDHEGGMMRMRELPSITVPPGASVALKPHGKHLMFIAPKGELQPGDSLDVAIDYAVADATAQKTVRFAVESR
ncbi:MAG: copper chaperone PCu(A)C [Algiphilus sp.]